MTLRSGVADSTILKKHHVQHTQFGHYYNCIDHHQKIIPYNVDQESDIICHLRP
jgi:hypothetical protein